MKKVPPAKGTEVRPLKDFPKKGLQELRCILTDIDGTLTIDGKLTSEAYTALWKIHASGRKVIPVTGRPAGWCDCIVRQWPVAAVVGENGAFALIEEDGGVSVLLHDSMRTSSGKQTARLSVSQPDPCLDDIFQAVVREIPEARKAKDQFSRIYDLAVDFREDEPRLPLSAAGRIKEIAESFGAYAKISSIHVNIWFGDYDKLGMSVQLLKGYLGLSDEDVASRTAFIGDSPNDEPMFGFFPLSVGVADIREYLAVMNSLPLYVTTAPGGEGFAEFAEAIIS